MEFLSKAWYRQAPWLWLLWPLSVIVLLVASIRRRDLKKATKKGQGAQLECPVIVIGNITAGGTGKTPLIITLANHLKTQGFKPAVISRGYRSSASSFPLAVTSDLPVSISGDEPALIHRQTQCPVVIDPNRRAALDYVLKNEDVDVVLSDDGLQHYGLPRSFEICVVDGERLFGNGLCIPAGPLRESVSKLQEVDAVVLNGGGETDVQLGREYFTLKLEPRFLNNMVSGEKKPFSGAPFKMGSSIQAVAGLGNPQRFFGLLETLPYPVTPHAFSDHHQYRQEDFQDSAFNGSSPIVMTEKDGIKCEAFADDRFWTLDVAVQVESKLLEQVCLHVQEFS